MNRLVFFSLNFKNYLCIFLHILKQLRSVTTSKYDAKSAILNAPILYKKMQLNEDVHAQICTENEETLNKFYKLRKCCVVVAITKENERIL